VVSGEDLCNGIGLRTKTENDTTRSVRRWGILDKIIKRYRCITTGGPGRRNTRLVGKKSLSSGELGVPGHGCYNHMVGKVGGNAMHRRRANVLAPKARQTKEFRIWIPSRTFTQEEEGFVEMPGIHRDSGGT